MSEQIQKGTEEANKKKIEKAKQRQAKNDALVILKELVDKQQDPKYKKSLATIRPSLYGISRKGGGASSTTKFIAFVAEKGSIKEDVIFREFKYGRKDCASQIRNHLRKIAPAERVWISFNPDTETYKVEGKGPKAPANWEGFVPTEENVNIQK